MKNLPESLDPNKLLFQEWPGDVTLGEIKPVIIARLPEMPKTIKKIVVRFVDANDVDYPDTMTLAEIRALLKAGARLHIIIEDGSGGMKVLEPA